MGRQIAGLMEFSYGLRRATGSAAEIFSTADGRWTIASTSVMALVAGSIAWLAAGTIPPLESPGSGARDRGPVPYQLFMKLTQSEKAGRIAFGAMAPLADLHLPSSAKPTDTDPAASLDTTFASERTTTESDSDSGTDARTVTLDRGESLVGALSDAGVSKDDANAAILALARVYDPRAVQAGETFEISFTTIPEQPVAQITYSPPSQAEDESFSDEDEGDGPFESLSAPPIGKLLSLKYSPTADRDITITRGADGTFTANEERKTLVARYHRAGATIDSSLYLAAMQAGIPADIVVRMIHMFSYEVDFQRDLRPGNSFEVLYNYYYTPDGQPAKEGDIAYAEMKLGGRSISLYRYRPKDDVADYFDAKGQSARSMLMKTPVDGARITSGFGMRFHPVLGYTRMHKGIDFGVPIGTPVMAAGSGVIQKEGRLGGYGNFILINHQNGYSTAYGHLSRFAPGIHVGSRVRQGQVIAYSGNTGMSTGPHLHYEIRVHDAQVNPAKVKVATGRRLFGRDLRNFLVERLQVDTELASMPLETKLAEGGDDLRATRD